MLKSRSRSPKSLAARDTDRWVTSADGGYCILSGRRKMLPITPGMVPMDTVGTRSRHWPVATVETSFPMAPEIRPIALTASGRGLSRPMASTTRRDGSVESCSKIWCKALKRSTDGGLALALRLSSNAGLILTGKCDLDLLKMLLLSRGPEDTPSSRGDAWGSGQIRHTPSTGDRSWQPSQ